MSTFFQQTAQAMIAKHIDRFPLLKLDQVIDWQPIEQYLNRQRTRYLRDHRGRGWRRGSAASRPHGDAAIHRIPRRRLPAALDQHR